MYGLLIVSTALCIALVAARPQQIPQRPLRIPNAAPAPVHIPNNAAPAPLDAFPRSVSAKRIDDEDDLAESLAARYEFSSNIEDHINDLTNQRSEVRENGAVQGSYSYSDGYAKRTVHYVADQGGFRVLRMEVEPLNQNGPQVDLSGKATVSNAAHGTLLNYSVQSVPTGNVPRNPVPRF